MKAFSNSPIEFANLQERKHFRFCPLLTYQYWCLFENVKLFSQNVVFFINVQNNIIAYYNTINFKIYFHFHSFDRGSVIEYF